MLFLAPVLAAGLVAMTSFSGEGNFASRQLLWIIVSLAACTGLSFLDFRFLRRTDVLVSLFLGFSVLLGFLFILGNTAKGATSWFSFAGFSFQPADFMKLVLILVLAKYFSRRHVEIANTKHILVSGLYALIPFTLVLLQPDFGSAIIIFLIWFGMVLVSGISKKHLFAVFALGLVSFSCLWLFVFKPYQKARIMTFVQPLADITGTGYNAYQSTVAVGSGKLLGKGVGYGTQSRLNFLPEHETDFIFAAFAEEWGFVGAVLLLLLFALVIWRIIAIASLGLSNFEVLYGLGLAIFFMSHIIINIGMNIGLFPVTGITLPFMSYGGSHLLTEFAGLGILFGMRRYSRTAHRDDMKNEFLGA